MVEVVSLPRSGWLKGTSQTLSFRGLLSAFSNAIILTSIILYYYLLLYLSYT
jgi:hypothetical protein